MNPFERNGSCRACGREYAVSGRAVNPGAETEAAARLSCECGGDLVVFLPGSVNREQLEVEPKLVLEE